MNRPRLKKCVAAIGTCLCVVLALVSLCGCPWQRQTNPPTSREEPMIVGVNALVRIYRDRSDADTLYTNRTVKIQLEPQTYVIVGQQIHWFNGLPQSFPTIVFDVIVCPQDNHKRIELTGRCRGRFHDGQSRGSGIDFFLRIDDCAMIVK